MRIKRYFRRLPEFREAMWETDCKSRGVPVDGVYEGCYKRSGDFHINLSGMWLTFFPERFEEVFLTLENKQMEDYL